jgi:hypothetical protein
MIRFRFSEALASHIESVMYSTFAKSSLWPLSLIIFGLARLRYGGRHGGLPRYKKSLAKEAVTLPCAVSDWAKKASEVA